MTTTAPVETHSANEYVSWLALACDQMGYTVHIHEPSTRLTISTAYGKPWTHETVTLKAEKDGQLVWWWSWGQRMRAGGEVVRGEQIGEAARQIAHVVKG